MSEILYNIYIWVFTVNSESDLNLAFVHVICCIAILLKTVFFCTFWRLKILILWRKIVQNFLIFVLFILSKKQYNWFYKNLHNSGMVGGRKLPDPSLNYISIDAQYTLSLQLTNFGLKCLLRGRIYCGSTARAYSIHDPHVIVRNLF